MTEFERIVRAHRRRQLRWTADSVQRIDAILNRAALEASAKLKRVAGTGKLQEHYLSGLVGELGKTLDTLRDAHSDLMGVHLLGSAQINADREATLAGRLFSGRDLEEMTRGLAPEMIREVNVGGVGRVQVGFGLVSEHAVNAIYQRVFSDGLTLSDRLWRLDSETRRAIEDRVIGAVADGTSARDLARDIRGYLTEAGQQNARGNSMRLARTEIAHAYREGHVQAVTTESGELKPFVHALGFRLSASHPEPDICDEWASQDIDGLGPGNYLPENVPVDHPHGMCFTVTILERHQDQQFVTKEPQPGAVSDGVAE